MIIQKTLYWNGYRRTVMEPDAKNNYQSIANTSAAFSRDPACGAVRKEMKDRTGTNVPPLTFAKRARSGTEYFGRKIKVLLLVRKSIAHFPILVKPRNRRNLQQLLTEFWLAIRS